jgi:hypothetical protein
MYELVILHNCSGHNPLVPAGFVVLAVALFYRYQTTVLCSCLNRLQLCAEKSQLYPFFVVGSRAMAGVESMTVRSHTLAQKPTNRPCTHPNYLLVGRQESWGVKETTNQRAMVCAFCAASCQQLWAAAVSFLLAQGSPSKVRVSLPVRSD